MFTQILIVVFVGALGSAALYGLHRLVTYVAAVSRTPPPEEPAPPSEPSAPVFADGLVYLFAHEFVRAPHEHQRTHARRQVFAPLTGEERDPRDLGEQILFATLVRLHDEGLIELRLEECEPSFFPPFPHKRWTMLLGRRGPLPPSPVADVLGRGLDMLEAKLEKQGQLRPYVVPLDEAVEHAIRIARQELTFWQRAGVYADLRSYVEDALIAQGYLITPARETWLERARQTRPQIHEEAVRELEPAAVALRRSLERFRDTHGRPPPEGPLPDQHPRTLADVDPAIITEEFVPGEMPLYDCLRISIHEALANLRQVEPSEEV